jgi:Flp pilus assembly protein TadD
MIDENAQEQIAQQIIPPELLNNLAVLQLEAGNLADAKVLLTEALQNCEILLKHQDDDRVKALRITVKFNLAWC